jgi:transposase
MEINQSQKMAAINLYKEGVTNYKDISERLGVSYNSINRIMTKWKKDTGILGKKKVEEQPPKQQFNQQWNDALMRELIFLREYYLNSISNKH